MQTFKANDLNSLCVCFLQSPDEIETDSDLEDEQEMYDSRSRCKLMSFNLCILVGRDESFKIEITVYLESFF